MKIKLRSDKKNEIVCEKKERIVLSGEEDCMYSVRRRFHSVFRTADGAFASDMHKTGRSCSRIYGFTVLFIAFYRKKCLTERGTMIYLSRHVICVCEQSIHANITLTTRPRGSRPYGQPGQLPSGGQRAAIIDCVRSAIL